MGRDIVVFSTLSKSHDLPVGEGRDRRWRPLIQMLRVPDFPIQRLYCFLPPSLASFQTMLRQDMATASPDTEVNFVIPDMPRDFDEADMGLAYQAYDRFFDHFTFNIRQEKYFFHFGQGNAFAHAFMLTMLINSRHMPVQLLHVRLPPDRPTGALPYVNTFNCSISSWISRISTFERAKAESLDLLKSSIPTRSPAFNQLISRIEHVAATSTAPILLSGPTGSGKSQLARRIYELRRKKGLTSGNFVEVNCATLRGDSALSNLFGHVKGAYTGAYMARKGYLLMAHHGILFLDEIGELSADMQILLLKAIEEKRFMPFGSDEQVESSFQLICASNRDLRAACRVGEFRSDLLSRINLWHFELPSLQERPEDIEPNMDYELKRLAEARGVFAEFEPEARRLYVEFATSPQARWPGNFRSLAGSMERMVTCAYYGVVDTPIVNEEIALLKRRWSDGGVPPVSISSSPAASSVASTPCPAPEVPEIGASGSAAPQAPSFPLLTSLGLDDRLDLFDKAAMEGVLEVCRTAPTRSEAGKKLFDLSRTRKTSHDDTARLNKYLRTHDLTWERVKRALTPH